MKKSLRKVIVTLSAVAALSLAMGATAMADVTTSEIQDGKATVTYTATGKQSGEQVTVLLLKPDANATNGIDAGEIAYIDQKAAGTDGSVEFTMPITGVAEGQTYALMSGSATATEVTKDNANFAAPTTSAGLLGDVNNDTAINVTDAGLIVNHVLGTGTIDKTTEDGAKMFARADVNVDTAVNVTDAGLIVNHVLGTAPITGEAVVQ